MANNTVSIYIDDTSVRLMVTRGKRIVRMADLSLELGLAGIDTEEKEIELAGKIKNLMKINKVGGGKIILGISGLHCMTRPIVLPELPKAMIGEAVIREAKRLLPMPLEQLYLSWQIVSVSGGKIYIYLAALPHQIADMIIRVINRAGCKPYLMDIKPLALARVSREATAVIVDVQSKEFDIVVMVDGIPQPVRTVAFPKESLPLADKFAIVQEDLKRTLEFVKSKVEENQVKPDTALLISGELAGHPELYEPLATELGLKAALLASPLKYLKYLEPSNYLVNIGLALKEITKESGPSLPNFNTLPEPYQPRHISMNKLMAVPAALAAVGVIALLVVTVQQAAGNIDMVQSQLDNTNFLLEKKQVQRKEMSDRVAALEQQIAAAEAEFNTYKAALKSLADTGGRMNTDLTTSVDNMVHGLVVASLSIGGTQISIGGTADSEDEVFEYVRNLTATGRFKEITINNITLNQGSEEGGGTSVSYSLNCVLEGERK